VELKLNLYLFSHWVLLLVPHEVVIIDENFCINEYSYTNDLCEINGNKNMSFHFYIQDDLENKIIKKKNKTQKINVLIKRRKSNV
jgi:hypothetical protein